MAAEIDQVSRLGKAGVVRGLVRDAAALAEDEQFEDAVRHALQAKALAPRSGVVRELLGLSYYRLGRWREAAREIAAYRRLSDRHDRDHLYADCERALGRPQRALEILEEPCGEIDEGLLVERLLVAAGALRDLDRAADAVERLKTGPVSPRVVLPHHLRLWYALADALEAAGRRPEARTYWDLLYAEDPEFHDVARRRLRRS